MEFDNVINNRKSVRSYNAKDLSAADIHKIITCGDKAPSACGLRPNKYMTVREEDWKNKIVATTYLGNSYDLSINQTWMLKAPVFIIICVDMQKCKDKYGNCDYKKTAYLNASACIENMLLKAVDLGIDGCYITGFDQEKLNNCLELDENLEAVAVLTLGYEKKLHGGH